MFVLGGRPPFSVFFAATTFFVFFFQQAALALGKKITPTPPPFLDVSISSRAFFVSCFPRARRGRFEEQERAAASGGKQKEDVSDIVAEENRKRKRKLEKKEKEKAGDKGKRYKDSFKF